LGEYRGTLSEAFPLDKVIFFITGLNPGYDTNLKQFTAERYNNNEIHLTVGFIDYDGGFNGGGYTDGWSLNIEIRVYP
jgi:hypothetical protein